MTKPGLPKKKKTKKTKTLVLVIFFTSPEEFVDLLMFVHFILLKSDY